MTLLAVIEAQDVIIPLVLFGIGLWLGWLMFRRARKLFLRAKRRGDEFIQDAKGLRSQIVALRMGMEGKPARLPLLFKAQNGEDLTLFELFNPPGAPLKTSGLAIECGAHDGELISVTYILDAMGWDCVLVEPLPDLAAKCRAARPHARIIEAALSKRGSTGTAELGMVVGREDRSFLAGRSHGGRGTSKQTRTVTVPLSTMDAALAGETRQVDVLVLDVEGAELSVLDGFDLDRFKPRVMIIEDHSLGEDPALPNYLEPRGYRHMGWIWRNRIFIRTDDPEMQRRAAALLQTKLGMARTVG